MCKVQRLGGTYPFVIMYIGSRVTEVLEAAMNICAESCALEEITWRTVVCDKLAPYIQRCERLQAALQGFLAEDWSIFKPDVTRNNLLVAIAGAAAEEQKHRKRLVGKKWPTTNERRADKDHRIRSPKGKVAVFICHESASSRAFRRDGYCIAATASWRPTPGLRSVICWCISQEPETGDRPICSFLWPPLSISKCHLIRTPFQVAFPALECSLMLMAKLPLFVCQMHV